MLIKKEVQQFIKIDSDASIGSEGIIGDRLLVISNGSIDGKTVKEGQLLASSEPVETDQIMESLKVTAGNAAMATEDLSEILFKINHGDGTLGRLINDEGIAKNIDQTIVNLKSSTKGLNENMEAAKSNFLLRGFYKKKEKAAAKKKKEDEKKQKEAEEKAKKEAERKAKEAETAK